MSSTDQDTNLIVPKKTLEEIKNVFRDMTTADYPNVALREANKELAGKEKGSLGPTSAKSNIFKSMSIFEFENGILMTTIVAEQYKTFGINMMMQLQKEFNCQTISEQATAELATVNYIRTLEIQNRIDRYLALGTLTDNGVKFLAIMSLELDRANRHFLTTIQALKTMKQPQLGVNIKAQTAIVGQNQMIQANNLLNNS